MTASPDGMVRGLLLIGAAGLLAACAGDMPRGLGDGTGGGSDKRVTLMDSGSDNQALDKGQVTPDASTPQPDVKPWNAPDVMPWPQPDTQPWSHDVGKTCTTNADCMFNICATNTHTGVKFCTKVCDPCSAVPCPTGSGCQNAGMAYICAPGYPDAPCPP